ncbi:MAG: DNA-directed RNA polymerase subunit alpha C-terminal domain-containing protein [Candidatus Eutrophobiaceae bacterium]
MRPILAFLFALGENDQWCCKPFRDFETLFEAAITANGDCKYPVGVHVGFERPDTASVEELLSKQEGLVFLSSGAMGTMPFPVRASQKSIGLAGENSFHAVLDGFGYQIEQADVTQPASLHSTHKTPIPENTEPRGWVTSLPKIEPELAQELRAVGIWDEGSYLLREIDLDFNARYLVGLRRYEILEGEQPNAATLIESLRSAPPWILDAKIALLNLSVRSKNVCAANDIKTIRDFAKYGLRDLYKLPNLGKKSISEISRGMAHLFTTGHPLKAVASKLDWVIPEPIGDISTDSNNDSEGSDIHHGNDAGFRSFVSASITEGFIDVAQNLSQIEREIWDGRIGFRCDPMTLQQIADQIGKTRERVRQIEGKSYKKVYGHLFWDFLSRRVQGHLRGRTAPLFLNGLSAIDPWFEGAEQLAHPLRNMSDRMPRLEFHILTWSESPVISRISQEQWLEAIDEAKSILIAIADQNLSEVDALSQAASVLIGKGEDMREALQEEVSKHCIWFLLPDSSRILTGFGKSAAALVSGILQASDTPLHIDEIQRHIRANSTYEATNTRNIHRGASEIGLLYGRGIYGLMKHCPLNPSQMLAIRAEVEDIVSGGSPSRQWHSSEIYDELLNRDFAFDGKLTKYIINIALANSPNLVYLRRMIWGVRGIWNANADARLDVKQAIVSLLEAEGKPMRTEQIRSRLIERRGLNTYFQIQPSSPLVRLGPKLWGLEGRDLDMQQAHVVVARGLSGEESEDDEGAANLSLEA